VVTFTRKTVRTIIGLDAGVKALGVFALEFAPEAWKGNQAIVDQSIQHHQSMHILHRQGISLVDPVGVVDVSEYVHPPGNTAVHDHGIFPC
jgi:hypothetical protein